jgi:tetratricopeptide (TPR) repeat protein
MKKQLAAFVVTGLLLATCATENKTNTTGEQYGQIDGAFHGRWWSYYERAMASAAIGSLDLAEQDLRIAISERSRDAWSARTYGMHFVEYFPNRELGIIQFKRQNLEEAEKYLKKSLAYIDTERSHYYIDQITKARIAKGEISDTAAPTASTAGPALFTSLEVPVEIQAKDDVGVEAVTLNGELLPQRQSEKDITFRQQIRLDEGEHNLEVATKDLSNKESKQSLGIVVDLTAPTLSVFDPAPEFVTQQSSVTLRGAAADKHGVAKVVLLDGPVLAESGASETRLDFSTTVNLADGANKIIVVATDKAGNEIRTAVNVYRGAPKSAAARLWQLHMSRPDLLKIAIDTTTDPSALLAVIDSMLKAQAASDEPQILIDVNHPKEGGNEKNYTVPVKGKVVAKAPLDLLMVQGAPLEVPKDPNAAPGAAVQTEFDRNVPVQKGTNIIEVAAKDSAGHGARKRVTVDADPAGEIPETFNMAVGVIGCGDDVPEFASMNLGSSLVGQLLGTKRFRVLDRKNLDSVLQELKIGASDLAASETSLQLGKLEVAQLLLRGSVGKRDASIEVKVDAISTETGRIIDQFDAQITKAGDSADIENAMKRIAAALNAKFPRVSGSITKVVSPESFITSISTNESVEQNMYVLVIARGEPVKDDITGEVLQPGGITMLARGVVESVTASGSTVRRIHFKDEAPNLEAGFPAMTW